MKHHVDAHIKGRLVAIFIALVTGSVSALIATPAEAATNDQPVHSEAVVRKQLHGASSQYWSV